MRVKHIALLCSAVALPQLAMADPSADPQGLGTVHALLTYCTQVDPGDTPTFQAEWKRIAGGASDQQLGQLEQTAAYRQAFDLAIQALNQGSKQAWARACAGDASAWSRKDGSSGQGDGDS